TQALQERAILLVVEPGAHRFGYLGTDPGDSVDLVLGRLAQRIDRAEGIGQQLGDMRTDVSDVQPDEQSPQWPVFRRSDRLEPVRDRLVGEAFELSELLVGKRV